MQLDPITSEEASLQTAAMVHLKVEQTLADPAIITRFKAENDNSRKVRLT